MKTLVVRVIALLAVAFPATANAQNATHNWTGFYAGAHAGGAWGDGDVDVACNDPTAFFDGTPNCAASKSSGFPDEFSIDASGFIGGGQAGYNIQTGILVLGLEADISWTDLDNSDLDDDALILGLARESSVSTDIEWLGTVRGRIGLAQGNWLFYATGGLAYAKVDYEYSFSLRPAGRDYIASDSQSKVQTGWTVGGGAEVAIGQWSLKGEYLYFDLGDEELSAEGILNGVRTSSLGQPIHFQPDFETQGHIARIALNFHFN